MELDACLPAALRGPGTTITKVAVGYSGAGVYRVDAGGRAFVLKVSRDGEPIDAWRRAVKIHQHAAAAGLAPRVVHVDEACRAVVSEFVVDRGFAMFYHTPATRDAALVLLGETVRRVHELPLPPDAEPKDARDLLVAARGGAAAASGLPAFADDAIAHVLAEQVPAAERPLVLSHNDLNPSNLVYDGERLLLLDWDAAGANDPLFDLAVLALFLRMDESTCRLLVAAHDGAPVDALPARFTHFRRVVGVVCGAGFLNSARGRGHAGATGRESLESAPTLGEFYGRLRSGQASLASADGHWEFGLALMREGMTT